MALMTVSIRSLTFDVPPQAAKYSKSASVAIWTEYRTPPRGAGPPAPPWRAVRGCVRSVAASVSQTQPPGTRCSWV